MSRSRDGCCTTLTIYPVNEDELLFILYIQIIKYPRKPTTKRHGELLFLFMTPVSKLQRDWPNLP